MITIESEAEMKAFGARLGAALTGGEVIELVGDVGAGKTTLTKGIAEGMGVSETVQSPSFTISRVYDDTATGLRLAHYDFYRLHDAGIMADELQETAQDAQTVTIIEWADIVTGVLPDDRLTVAIVSPTELSRCIDLQATGPAGQRLVGVLA
jgi:tRNA threonylcarbamoyladenosine biosynthesis protein TsaE